MLPPPAQQPVILPRVCSLAAYIPQRRPTTCVSLKMPHHRQQPTSPSAGAGSTAGPSTKLRAPQMQSAHPRSLPPWCRHIKRSVKRLQSTRTHPHHHVPQQPKAFSSSDISEADAGARPTQSEQAGDETAKRLHTPQYSLITLA